MYLVLIFIHFVEVIFLYSMVSMMIILYCISTLSPIAEKKTRFEK